MVPSRKNTPQATAQVQLRRYSLTQDQTRYIPTKSDLKIFLQETFHREYHLADIWEKNARWIYQAERELEDKEVRQWIERLDAEKEARRAQAAAQARQAAAAGSA